MADEIDEILKFDPMRKRAAQRQQASVAVIDDVLKYDPGNQPRSQQEDVIDEVLKFDPVPGGKPPGKWSKLAEAERAKEQGSGKWSRLAAQSAQTTPEQPLAEGFQGAAAGTLEEPMEWKEVFHQAYHNIPSSAYGLGKDVYQAIRHPIETAKAVGKLGVGAVEKLIPGTQEYEQYADAFAQSMYDRYGSIENFKRTLAEDPVGVTTDIATIAIPVGKAIQAPAKIAQTSKIAQAAGKVGSMVERAGAVADPLYLAGKGARVLGAERAAAKLYQSAAKFSTVLPRTARQKLISTALEEAVSPTFRGVDQLRNRIDDIKGAVEAHIDEATKSGKTIPLERLFDDFDQLKADASFTGRPDLAERQIERIKKGILEAHEKAGRKALTPEQAQRLKQNIYREVESHYGKIRNSPASVKAQQAVARAAKESLEEIIPEVKGLNKRMGELIELEGAINKAAGRISNRDIMGLSTLIKATAGGAAAGVPGVAGGLALSVLGTPTVKSKVSILIHKLAQQGVKVKPNRALMMLLGTKAGREGRSQEGSEFTPF